MKTSGLSFVLILLLIFSIITPTNGLFMNYDQSSITIDENPNTPRSSRPWGIDKQLGGIETADLVLEQENHCVVSDGEQYLYCVWQDNREGDWRIYFTKSANAGNVWTDDIRISNQSTSLGNQFNPSLAVDPVDKSILYLSWQDERNDFGDIYFTYSLDNGQTWFNETQVNPFEKDPKIQWYPEIIGDHNGNVFVTWSDKTSGDWEILLSKTSDFGKTWSEPVRVNNPLPANKEQLKPSIGIDSNNIIYVAWEDDRSGEKQIYFSRSTDSGKTFIDEVRVSITELFVNARTPRLVVDNFDNIFIVWVEDDNSKYNVYFIKSLDLGQSFSMPIRVNAIENSCSADAVPDVSGDYKGNIYIAWSDTRSKNHIYLANSIDNGRSFVINEKIDDADNSSATGISITTQEELWRGKVELVHLENRIFTFWMDYRNNPNPDDSKTINSDIYYDWNFTIENRKPEKPQFIKTTISKDWYYINLSWKTSIDLDFVKYEVYKGPVQDFTPEASFLNATIGNRLQNYLNITGLASGRTYYFILRVVDYGGLWNQTPGFEINTKTNIPPYIEFEDDEPDGSFDDLVDNSYTIRWEDNDPDDNATIELFYDNNQNPLDGYNEIAVVPYGEDSEKDFYIWDTTNIMNGSYYIVAIISDQVNGDQFAVYSSGKLKVYHGNLDPWLVITFISPKNSTEVELDTELVVIFNKKTDASTIHSNSFYLTDSESNKVSGKYNLDNTKTKITFSPTNALKGLERYNITLTESIKDSTGMFKLYQDYQFWFQTKPSPPINGTILGEVVNEYYNPIEGAKIKLVDKLNQGRTWETVTDSKGEFLFKLDYGNFELTVVTQSYQNAVISNLTLNKQLLELQTIQMVRPELVDYSIDTTIKVTEKLSVRAYAVHPNKELLTYLWDFGDGVNETGQNISHKYKKTGTYEVTLTIIDNGGGYITVTELVEVEPDKLGLDYLMGVIYFLLLILIIAFSIIAIFVYIARKRRSERYRILNEEEKKKLVTDKKAKHRKAKKDLEKDTKGSRKKSKSKPQEKSEEKVSLKKKQHDDEEEIEDENIEAEEAEPTDIEEELHDEDMDSEFELEEADFAEELDLEFELDEAELEDEPELKKEEKPKFKDSSKKHKQKSGKVLKTKTPVKTKKGLKLKKR